MELAGYPRQSKNRPAAAGGRRRPRRNRGPETKRNLAPSLFDIEQGGRGRRSFNSWLRLVHREYLHLSLAVMGGWAIVLINLHLNASAMLAGFLAFVLAATFLTVVCLRVMGCLDRMSFCPSLFDMLALQLSTLLAGLVAYETLSILAAFSMCGSAGCDLTTVLLAAVYTATFTFLVDYVFSSALVRAGVRKRIVLDLLPHEHEALQDDFRESGLGGQLECLSREDLARELQAPSGVDIDMVVISKQAAHDFDRDAALIRAHLAGIRICDFCTISSSLTGKVKLPLTDQWAFLQQATKQTLLIRISHAIKSVSEPLMAVVMLMMFAPLMVLIAVAVKMTSKGPVLYRQRRLGYLGRPFVLIKFRTMRIDAEAQGPRWASANDPRITSLGNFLRRTRLDELPQLLNIARGEMSFVGPRPERPEIYDSLQERIPLFPLRLVVRPGITGWAQVKAGYAASVEESHKKLEYDLYYIQNFSPILDLVIWVRTLIIALVGERNERQARRASVQRSGKDVLPQAPAPAPQRAKRTGSEAAANG